VRFIAFCDLVLPHFILFCIGKTLPIFISFYFKYAYSVFRFSNFKINTLLVLSQLYTKGFRSEAGRSSPPDTWANGLIVRSFVCVAIVVVVFFIESSIYYSNFRRLVICVCNVFTKGIVNLFNWTFIFCLHCIPNTTAQMLMYCFLLTIHQIKRSIFDTSELVHFML